MKSLLPAALILTGFLPSVAFAQTQRAVPPAPSEAPAVGSVLDSQLAALGHKALMSITAQNAVAPLAKSPIPFMKTRMDLATFSLTPR
jgi:hypothetical protein